MPLNRLVRGAAVLVGAALAACLLATLYAQCAYRRVWDWPLPPTRASRDPAVIARGRYIVYGPGRCADCHVPDSVRDRLYRGEEVPLTGGPGEHTYLGNWTAPNLTPDAATGIGAVSDGQLARLIRHGIDRDGHIALPFMDTYADLAESDLTAIISFLRSLPPAPGVAPAARINLVGRVTLAYFLKPYGPAETPARARPPEPTAAYGRYAARTLCGCEACHTARSLLTGRYLSPFFSGGLPFRSRDHPGMEYVSPNLTPDPATGHITTWSEADFIRRFRSGLLIPDSPMAWGSFQRMTDTDLRALYRYLRGLPPVRRDNGPDVQPLHGMTAG